MAEEPRGVVDAPHLHRSVRFEDHQSEWEADQGDKILWELQKVFRRILVALSSCTLAFR
jgi:hypothetical protein